MKTLKLITLSSSCFLALLLTAAAQSTTPATGDSAAKSGATAAPAAEQPATEQKPATADQTPAKTAAGGAAVQTPAVTEIPLAPATAPVQTSNAAKPAAAATTASNGNKELRLNFRNAPLESVLNYLSDAAGFIIVPRVSGELRGKVTVWSGQPVTKEEAFDLLNTALDQNGYTAIRKGGRTLEIWNKEDAKKQNIPVKSSNKAESIPKNEEMVTQIIPVRFISAVQVSRDLQPLLPDKATMTANEGGNAILITDTQANIHHMVEIISALDTAIASISAVKVFKLKYADSKAVASVIKDLFAPQDTARGGGNNAAGAGRFFNQMRGGGAGGFGGAGRAGGGGGVGGSGGGGGGGGDSSGGRAPAPRVMAVAEERSNSVIVSAPDDQMPLVEEVIREVDTNVEDITELRVFHLKYADAQETAALLSSLFSTSNNSGSGNQGNRGQMVFGGRGFFPGGGNPFGGGGGGGGGGGRTGAASSDESTRLQKQTTVVAVADLRTGSVVVSAAKGLMDQIAGMIADLDADASKKQQVFVWPVQNTDPQQVTDILSSLFPQPMNGSMNSRMNSRQQNGAGNQLNSRAQQQQNMGSNRGNTGIGGGNRGGGGLGSSGGFGQ